MDTRRYGKDTSKTIGELLEEVREVLAYMLTRPVGASVLGTKCCLTTSIAITAFHAHAVRSKPSTRACSTSWTGAR